MRTKTFTGSEKALIIGIIFTVAVVIACIAMLGMVTPPGTPPKGNETEKEVNYSNFTSLLEDFNDLPEIKDGVDLKERNAKERILFLLRGDDPEIERAFEVLQKYGRPSNFTNYEFPAYNTQLEVLLWLAEEREISDYDRIALAIALDYGAVLAISDEEVRKELKDYVVNLYDYFVETDAIVPWDIRAYPLEADIALVWGANGINYPLFFEKKNQYPEGTKYNEIGIPNYYALNWIEVFRDKKMNEEDFDWLFVDVSTLKEIRAFLLHKMSSEGLKGLHVKGISERVDSMLCGSLEYHTDKPSAEVSYIEVEGRITPGCGLSNPDWQWKHFKEKSSIVGNCRDVTCMNIFFLKSLNIPAIGFGVSSGSSFGHQIVVFYDYEKDLWRITENQKEIIESHVEAPKLSVDNYFPVVWSNWHEKIYPRHSYEELKTLEEGFEIHEV